MCASSCAERVGCELGIPDDTSCSSLAGAAGTCVSKLAVHLVNGEIVDADYAGAVTVADLQHITSMVVGVNFGQVQILINGQELDGDALLEHLAVGATITAVLQDHPVRVCCRIRPMSGAERVHGASEDTRPQGTSGVEVVDADSFEVDRVFSPGSQEQIFDECRDLVRSVVDGCSGSIFVLGQSGAGKMFTLFGSSPCDEGIIPRSCREIFQAIDARSTHDFLVTCSYIQPLYSDVFDWLSCGHTIDWLANNEARLDSITEVECANADAMIALIERGNQNRTAPVVGVRVAFARAPFVVVVNVTRTDRSTQKKQAGHLLLCHFPGCEHITISSATGIFFKEAVALSQCLTACVHVLDAMARGNRVIPYKESPLTRMMQVLGSRARTVVFAALSPASTAREETLCSLRWARRMWLAGRSAS